MLVHLSRRKTTWAAYCDECLIGSPVIAWDDPRSSRAWAVAKLRALGWTHAVPPDLPEAGQRVAESAWTGETFCFECTAARARARAS
jgi:hypothetical protein